MVKRTKENWRRSFKKRFCKKGEPRNNVPITHAVDWLLPWTKELCRTAYQCQLSFLNKQHGFYHILLVFVGCEWVWVHFAKNRLERACMLMNNPVLIHWCTETVFKEKNIVYETLCRSCLSLTLSHSQHSQLSTPTTRGKGWSGEDLSYWLSKFVSVCWFPKQFIGKGGGMGWELTLCTVNKLRSLNLLFSCMFRIEVTDW